MEILLLLVILSILAASVLFIVGTIMYLVKAVRENSGKAPNTAKKAPIIVLSIGIFFDVIILLLVLLAVAAVMGF